MVFVYEKYESYKDNGVGWIGKFRAIGVVCRSDE